MFLYESYDAVYWVLPLCCRFKYQLSVQRPLSLFCPNVNLHLVEGKGAFLSVLTRAIHRIHQLWTWKKMLYEFCAFCLHRYIQFILKFH